MVTKVKGQSKLCSVTFCVFKDRWRKVPVITLRCWVVAPRFNVLYNSRYRKKSYSITKSEQVCIIVSLTSVSLTSVSTLYSAIFPYSCGVCRQCYGRHTAVMDHMRKTHSLPISCQHCGRGFGDKADLCRHEASHQNTKPFKCDVCGSR